MSTLSRPRVNVESSFEDNTRINELGGNENGTAKHQTDKSISN